MPHNPTLLHLSAKQRKAVEALLATGEVSAAARDAGVHRDTLHRWLKQPLFLAAVRETEARALDELSRLLVRLGRTAAATLAKAMSDPAAPIRPGCGRRMRRWVAYCSYGSWRHSRHE